MISILIKKYKNTILASLGVAFEYYDFIIYALMGVYLSDIFFQGNPSSNSFYYFSIFSLGYLFRPLGGLVFGLISDKYGRKKSFSLLIFGMAIATFTIGLLPTGKEYLHISIFLLVAARLLQGFSLGGELPNALLLVHETNSRNPIHSGILSSSATAGNILALLVMYALSYFLVLEEIIKWGWRLPFFLGGGLAITCYFLRKNLKETDEFLKIKDVVANRVISYPLKDIFRKEFKKVFFAMLLSGSVGSLIVVFFYLPTYLNQYYGYQVKDVSYYMVIALVFSFLLGPVVGFVASKIDKKKILISTAIITLLCGNFVFKLLVLGNALGLIIFILLYELVATILYVTNLAFLADLFNVKVRGTAVSFCYNAGTVIASFVPALLAFFIKTENYKSILLFFTCIVAFLIIISATFLWNKIPREASHD